MFYFSIILLLVTGPAWSQKNETIESVILQDLVFHSNEAVNIKNSNSAACKKPCTVVKYLSVHLNEMVSEIQKVKKTSKKAYVKTFGTSVDENSKLQTNFRGRCSTEERAPIHEGDLKAAKIKLPPEDKIIACRLRFGFEFGENVWSEHLIYLKNRETGIVIPGSFWAMGTP